MKLRPSNFYVWGWLLLGGIVGIPVLVGFLIDRQEGAEVGLRVGIIAWILFVIGLLVSGSRAADQRAGDDP